MPFTSDEFNAVFAQYNTALWLAPLLAYGAALVVIALLFARGAFPAAVITNLLAAMWLVNGIGYHWTFFSQINPMARLFAILFVLQAVALSVSTMVFKDLRFGVRRDTRSIIGLAMIAFAMVGYPLWGLWAGESYPAMPLFGVAPCPTTIFTVGVLLIGTTSAVCVLLVIPIFWAAVGGSAALLLGVPQDLSLIATLLIAILLGLGHWRGRPYALCADRKGTAFASPRQPFG